MLIILPPRSRTASYRAGPHRRRKPFQKEPGVVAFFKAADIPGEKTFNGKEILASTSVLYYGQPVALLAASTRRAALQAAAKVQVHYAPAPPPPAPVLSIRDALAAPDRERRVSTRLL